jgi:hypothetical protein
MQNRASMELYYLHNEDDENGGIKIIVQNTLYAIKIHNTSGRMYNSLSAST